MLSDAEKTHVRRFLGYPVQGADPAGNVGWQYYQAGGAVEYRLVHLSAAEEGVVRQYLATLAGLEQAIPEAGAGLDIGSAGGWVRNPAEIKERLQLFDNWRRRLCAFLGVPAGPELVGGHSVALTV